MWGGRAFGGSKLSAGVTACGSGDGGGGRCGRFWNGLKSAYTLQSRFAGRRCPVGFSEKVGRLPASVVTAVT